MLPHTENNIQLDVDPFKSQRLVDYAQHCATVQTNQRIDRRLSGGRIL